jgi:hypothetical protein
LAGALRPGFSHVTQYISELGERGSSTEVLVRYGAFEVTVGHDPNVPDGLSVLDQVADAGYAGIDLGPAGYLGRAEVLGERLAERGLGLAGANPPIVRNDVFALESGDVSVGVPRAPHPSSAISSFSVASSAVLCP